MADKKDKEKKKSKTSKGDLILILVLALILALCVGAFFTVPDIVKGKNPLKGLLRKMASEKTEEVQEEVEQGPVIGLVGEVLEEYEADGNSTEDNITEDNTTEGDDGKDNSQTDTVDDVVLDVGVSEESIEPVDSVEQIDNSVPSDVATNAEASAIPETSAIPGTAASDENNFDLYNNVEQQNTADKWVLNTSTMKIHYPGCMSVPKISEDNYATSNAELSELISQGYDRCGICNPN